MLKTRLTNAGGGTDNKHSKIWAVAGETKDGGPEVFLMASQVYQSDQLTGILADFFHSTTLSIVHNLQRDSHDVSILPMTLYQICLRENCLETVLPKNKQQKLRLFFLAIFSLQISSQNNWHATVLLLDTMLTVMNFHHKFYDLPVCCYYFVCCWVVFVFCLFVVVVTVVVFGGETGHCYTYNVHLSIFLSPMIFARMLWERHYDPCLSCNTKTLDITFTTQVRRMTTVKWHLPHVVKT